MGRTVVPNLGWLHFKLVTEVAFLLGGCWAGGCAPHLAAACFPWSAAATVWLRWIRWISFVCRSKL